MSNPLLITKNLPNFILNSETIRYTGNLYLDNKLCIPEKIIIYGEFEEPIEIKWYSYGWPGIYVLYGNLLNMDTHPNILLKGPEVIESHRVLMAADYSTHSKNFYSYSTEVCRSITELDRLMILYSKEIKHQEGIK